VEEYCKVLGNPADVIYYLLLPITRTPVCSQIGDHTESLLVQVGLLDPKTLPVADRGL
jgi:hypothetical protein